MAFTFTTLKTDIAKNNVQLSTINENISKLENEIGSIKGSTISWEYFQDLGDNNNEPSLKTICFKVASPFCSSTKGED